jgi:hypothetical protein
MKSLLFIFTIANAYYLYPYSADTHEFLIRKQSIGPIKINGFSEFYIYADGYIKFSNSCKSIGIFRLNQSVSADIYYSDISTKKELMRYSKSVRDDEFCANYGFRISWVNHLVNAKGEFNNFQLVLLRNGTNTIILLNYFKIFTNLDLFVGITNEFCISKPFFELVNSGFLEKKTNARKRGFWVFEVEQYYNSGIILIMNYNVLIFYLIKYLINF